MAVFFRQTKILFFVVIFIINKPFNGIGQVQKDSKFSLHYGFSAKILTSKHFTSSFTAYGEAVTSYKSEYSKITPETSFFMFAKKNRLILKGEWAFSWIYTKHSYDVIYYSSSTNIYYGGYKKGHAINEYNMDITNIKLGAGIMIKKFSIIPSIDFSYILRGGHDHEIVNTSNSSQDKINSKPFYGINLECNYNFTKNWSIGLEGFQQLFSKEKNGISKKYSLSSLKFSVSYLINPINK